MRLIHYMLMILLALGAGFLGAHFAQEKNNTQTAHIETPFERVSRTGTLRCGYIVWPPEFNKDLNTGKFSGVAYDILAEAAKRLGWKIDWVEEVNFTTMAAALKANRFDAICFSLYRDAPRALFSKFTVPLYYSGTGVYVRVDDARFDGLPISSLNNPKYTIATMDGEMSAMTANRKFPLAKQVTIPNSANPSDLLLSVVGKKADLTFANTLVGEKYMQMNPGILKNIAAAEPIQIFSHGFAFRKDETELVDTLDVVLQEMHDQGAIDMILDQYPQEAGAFYRSAQPYRQQ